MKRFTKEQKAREHLCTHPGCNRPWTSYFGRGKVCGEHAQPGPNSVPVPRTPPQPHWLDKLEAAS